MQIFTRAISLEIWWCRKAILFLSCGLWFVFNK